MNRLFIILLVCIGFIAKSQTKKDVLFLGNSYTYVNDLPSTLARLASSVGDSVFHDQSTPGGYRLMNHASNQTTYDKIHSNTWDFVVIQAQSQEPSWPVSQIENEVYPYAKQIADSVRDNNNCTEIIFFDTWGRKNGDSDNCASWPPVCTFAGMNDRLLIAYYTMAEQNSAMVAPVGMAWKTAIEDNIYNNIDLYSGDGSHPSIYGTYLTACVFYNIIFHKNINSDFYYNLPESEAIYLQNVANSIFSDEFQYFISDTVTNNDYTFTKQSWFSNGVTTISGFSYNQENLTVYFSNNSINANSFIWNFGDGSQESYEIFPSHNYNINGNYQVRLISHGNCNNDTLIKNIDIATIINDNICEKIKILKSSNKIIIKNDGNIKNIKLYTITGKIIAQKNIIDNRDFIYNASQKAEIIIAKITLKNNKIVSRKFVFE